MSSDNTNTTSAYPSAAKWKTFLAEYAAGSMGGFAGIVVGYPLDTVRVRLQTQQHLYKNTLDCFVKTIGEENVRGLFKGMLSPLLGEMINNCLLFGVYGMLKPFQEQYHEKQYPRIDSSGKTTEYSLAKEVGAVALSGALAGFVITQIVTPTELIKIQLQVNTEKIGMQSVGKRGFADCASHIYRQGALRYNSPALKVFGGVRGLYHGYVSTLIRELTFNALYFVSYEWGKRFCRSKFNKQGEQDLGVFSLLLAGGIAGTLSWFVLYPTDILKSVVQADTNMKTGQALRQLNATGIKAWTAGMTATVIRAFPVNAATFLAYEMTMKMLSGNDKV